MQPSHYHIHQNKTPVFLTVTNYWYFIFKLRIPQFSKRRCFCLQLNLSVTFLLLLPEWGAVKDCWFKMNVNCLPRIKHNESHLSRYSFQFIHTFLLFLLSTYLCQCYNAAVFLTDLHFLDFKLSPCSICNMFSFGYFPGVLVLIADVSNPLSVPSSWAGGWRMTGMGRAVYLYLKGLW